MKKQYQNQNKNKTINLNTPHIDFLVLLPKENLKQLLKEHYCSKVRKIPDNILEKTWEELGKKTSEQDFNDFLEEVKK